MRVERAGEGEGEGAGQGGREEKEKDLAVADYCLCAKAAVEAPGTQSRREAHIRWAHLLAITVTLTTLPASHLILYKSGLSLCSLPLGSHIFSSLHLTPQPLFISTLNLSSSFSYSF